MTPLAAFWRSWLDPARISAFAALSEETLRQRADASRGTLARLRVKAAAKPKVGRVTPP
jgi:hypothetical protein